MLIKFDADYQNTSMDRFAFIRFDQDTRKTNKSIGGGLCMAVIDRWATNFTVHETNCLWHLEIMTVIPSLLFTSQVHSIVILAYVPGPDNMLADERIADSYNNAVSRAADQPVFLFGDFNSCDVTPTAGAIYDWTECWTYVLEIYLLHMSLSPALLLASQTIM